MVAPRHPRIRGTVVRGESGHGVKAGHRLPLTEREVISDPTKPRAGVEYILQRRSALQRLFTGGCLTSEFCEADTYLLRAAKFHGESSGESCPVCKDAGFVYVTYVYGEELGPYSGRVRQTKDLESMASKFGRFTVYVVEVCQKCQWNFLIRTYVLGDGVPRKALPTPRDPMEV